MLYLIDKLRFWSFSLIMPANELLTLVVLLTPGILLSVLVMATFAKGG
jgi:hypothetical protein